MKIKIFLTILFLTPSLVARERLPIPAGRFEALTGIKVTKASSNGSPNENSINFVWDKYLAGLKPAATIFLSSELSSLVFPATMNLIVTNERTGRKDYDSAVISEISYKDEWLTKMLKKNAVIFLKSEQSLKEIIFVTESLGYKIFLYSAETGEYLLKKI